MTDILIDEWILFENETNLTDIQKITFNGDYTVYVDNQKYLWEIESESETYLSIKILDGASKFGRVNLNLEDSYRLSLGIYDKEQDAYIDYRNFFSDTNYELIEITADNWNTYFEITDYHHFNKDAFDEINSYSLYQILRLKDEYYGKLLNANYKIAYELSYDECEWAIDIDYPNQSATLKDKIKKTYPSTRKGTFTNTSVYEENYFGTNFFSSSESIDYYDKKIIRCDNIKIDRIQGHFYLQK